MKYGVLLIGFEYIHSKRWDTLPGIPADLYQAYRYTKTISKNILVFTDIDKDYNTTVLQKAILDGYVDSGLLSFIEDTKERNQYTQYHSNQINGYNINNFDQIASEFVKGLDRLFIYYTGHGKGGDIILPDNTHVPLSYFRDIIVANTINNCQIISILDCCESNGMELPYKYIDGNYHLINHNFVHQRILCISSSHSNEDSAATRSGSLFTRILFGYLYSHFNQVITISALLDVVSTRSNICIYSTYPNIRILWNWFVKSSHNNLDVSIDNNNSLILVQLNNCQRTVEKSASMRDYIRYHHNGRYEPSIKKL